MHGDAVALTDGYGWWWLYIGHFIHSPFYCYAYAFGELLVLALVQKYKQEGAGLRAALPGAAARGRLGRAGASARAGGRADRRPGLLGRGARAARRPRRAGGGARGEASEHAPVASRGVRAWQPSGREDAMAQTRWPRRGPARRRAVRDLRRWRLPDDLRRRQRRAGHRRPPARHPAPDRLSALRPARQALDARPPVRLDRLAHEPLQRRLRRGRLRGAVPVPAQARAAGPDRRAARGAAARLRPELLGARPTCSASTR